MNGQPGWKLCRTAPTGVLISICLAWTCFALPPAAQGQDARPEKPAGQELARARKHFEAGARAYETGKLHIALDHFLKAYRLAPSPELLFNLARVYERMGEAEQGIHHFRRYLQEAKVSAKERRAVEARISALDRTRSRRRAQLTKRAPSSDDLTAEAKRFFDRGLTLYGRGKYEAARRAFTAAQRFTSIPEVYYNLAITSQRLAKEADAIDYYRAYLRGRPDALDKSQIQRRIRRLREAGN